jgi:tetratricopeptide (TPR) repeat protein
MKNILLFSFLWVILGNPLAAIIVLLIILYLIDRKFVGLFPSLTRPFAVRRRISRLRQELGLNPHNASAKLDLARSLMETKKYREALPLLEETLKVMDGSSEVMAETGLCLLKTGQLKEGEERMRKAFEQSPQVKYGEPYLQLGEAFASTDPDKAVKYLEKFKETHYSSCKAYYHLGSLYAKLGRKDEARQAFREAAEIYRTLPKYKRKTERRWALLSALKKIG